MLLDQELSSQHLVGDPLYRLLIRALTDAAFSDARQSGSDVVWRIGHHLFPQTRSKALAGAEKLR